MTLKTTQTHVEFLQIQSHIQVGFKYWCKKYDHAKWVVKNYYKYMCPPYFGDTVTDVLLLWQAGAGTLVYKKTTSVSMSYHLYLSVEEIDHTFPDDMELFFRLYDTEKKEYIR